MIADPAIAARIAAAAVRRAEAGAAFPVAADAPGGGAVAMLGLGEVRHRRLRPAAHRFEYRSYFLMLPMRSLRAEPSPALRRNRFGLIAFHDRDHGDGRADCLGWLEELLDREGVEGVDGEVWLHCLPRVLGHTFKPVSFWYCQRRGGSLAAVVVEVNNTFGERHCYLLDGADVRWRRELRATKVFHVSPFCAVSGDYRFRFVSTGLHPGPMAARDENAMEPPPTAYAIQPPRTLACIDHHDANGLLIRTSVSGRLQPLTPASARAAFFRLPLLTLLVVCRIHWQALRLWYKRVPFFGKPAMPASFVSR